MTKKKAPDFTGCRGCRYYIPGVDGRLSFCNYMSDTNRQRGCSPGAGCTRRDTGDRSPDPSIHLTDGTQLARRIQAETLRQNRAAAAHFDRMTRPDKLAGAQEVRKC